MDNIFFISCILPLVLVLHWIVPWMRGKNAVLLVLSLVFYSFSGLSGLALLLVVAAVNYLLGLGLKTKLRKAAMITGVVLDVAFLCAYKYLDFILADVLGLAHMQPGLIAPLGISFFVFKCISYLVDGYRDQSRVTCNAGKLLLYISFFPQITMGPITRFSEFEPQLKERTISLDQMALGLRRFAVGLGKKILIAGTVASVVDGVFALEAVDIRLAWVGAIAYCIQLYFDFSGYIDMVIGLGVALGFTTRENFNYPYIAPTVGQFWRRWHMSLSTWFKDYVYIPLGGNRKGQLRAGINKCIVFLLCGLWHGAAWTFVLWGLWHGLFSLLESLNVIPAKRLEKGPAKILGHVYTLLVVCIGFVMFRAGTVAQGAQIIGAMFAGFKLTAAGTVALYKLLSVETVLMLVMGIVLSMPVSKKLSEVTFLERISYIGAIVVFVLSVLKLAAGDFAPSIYAQF